MNVGREEPGGEAIGVVNLDSVPNAEALEAVQKLPGHPQRQPHPTARGRGHAPLAGELSRGRPEAGGAVGREVHPPGRRRIGASRLDQPGDWWHNRSRSSGHDRVEADRPWTIRARIRPRDRLPLAGPAPGTAPASARLARGGSRAHPGARAGRRCSTRPIPDFDNWDSFCRAYYEPVRCTFRGLPYVRPDQVDDLTQSFFAKLMEKGLLDQLHAVRGRFRDWLFPVDLQPRHRRLPQGPPVARRPAAWTWPSIPRMTTPRPPRRPRAPTISTRSACST